MKLLSDFIRTLQAKLKVTYELSSLQVNLPKDLADQIIAWGKENIPDNILHNDGRDTKGREDEIHFTIFYGIKSPDPNVLSALLNDFRPFDVRLGLITGFMDKPEYDVLKIDIECPEIYQMHYRIRNSIANENSFPSYAPHTTVAYLQKNNIVKWLGCTDFCGKIFRVNELIFSSSNGNKIPITLN